MYVSMVFLLCEQKLRAVRFSRYPVSSSVCSYICFLEIHKIYKVTYGKYSGYLTNGFAFAGLIMTLKSIFADKIGREFYYLW